MMNDAVDLFSCRLHELSIVVFAFTAYIPCGCLLRFFPFEYLEERKGWVCLS